MLVSHDGARWLPTVLAGLAAQRAPVAHTVAVDTGSKDDSPELLSAALGADAVVSQPASTPFGAALRAGLAHLDAGSRTAPSPRSGSGSCTTTPARTPRRCWRCWPARPTTPRPTCSARCCASGRR